MPLTSWNSYIYIYMCVCVCVFVCKFSLCKNQFYRYVSVRCRSKIQDRQRLFALNYLPNNIRAPLKPEPCFNKKKNRNMDSHYIYKRYTGMTLFVSVYWQWTQPSHGLMYKYSEIVQLVASNFSHLIVYLSTKYVLNTLLFVSWYCNPFSWDDYYRSG